MQGAEEQRSVGELGWVEDQPSCCILDELQRSDGTYRHTGQELVAVIKVRDDKGLDQRSSRVVRYVGLGIEV